MYTTPLRCRELTNQRLPHRARVLACLGQCGAEGHNPSVPMHEVRKKGFECALIGSKIVAECLYRRGGTRCPPGVFLGPVVLVVLVIIEIIEIDRSAGRTDDKSSHPVD